MIVKTKSKQSLIDLLYKYHNEELSLKELHRLIQKLDDLKLQVKSEYWDKRERESVK